MRFQLQLRCLLFLLSVTVPVSHAVAEKCATESQMSSVDSDAIKLAALMLAQNVQAGSTAAVQAATIPQFAQHFDGIASAIAATQPKLQGASLTVEGFYLLDATNLKTTGDAAFFCSLNNSAAAVNFSFDSLPPGRYAVALLHATGNQTPWQLTFVMQDVQGWKLAGFTPKPLTAASHDGVWYWTEARKYARQNQRWNAWLYYEQAESLLLPAAFIASTNLDRLHNEQTAVMPAEVMDSLRPDHPWSITAANEEKYAFTAMAPEPGIPATTLDLGIHITATDVSDPAQVRERNRRAALALLAAVPEVRGLFHGVWVYAEASGHSPFALEFSMADLAAAASPSK